MQCLRVSTQDRVEAGAFVPPPSFPGAALLYAEVQGLNERCVLGTPHCTAMLCKSYLELEQLGCRCCCVGG